MHGVTSFLCVGQFAPSLPPSLPPSVQGFLPADLVSEACRGLHKRCVAASEQLMQSLEGLDSIVSQSPHSPHTHFSGWGLFSVACGGDNHLCYTQSSILAQCMI